MGCWEVLGFIARLLDNLPEPHQQLLRYWGCYSNAARGRLDHLGCERQSPEPLSRAPPAVTELVYTST